MASVCKSLDGEGRQEIMVELSPFDLVLRIKAVAIGIDPEINGRVNNVQKNEGACKK
jgi:hypothetical protein